MNRLFISKVIFNGGLDQNSYLNDLSVIKHLKSRGELTFNKRVTFLVGENGTGKSTLIEAIAVAFGFNPEGGSRNFCFSTNDSHSELCDHITLAKHDFAKDGYFLRAESFYNVASEIERLDLIPAASAKIIESYGGKSLHKQSHGETFLSLVTKRFGGNSLFILDEPEAALSPSRILTLISEIKRLENKNSQFIIATHSPILMAHPDADIYQLTADGINLVNYVDTEHYKVTKSFFENPERMINILTKQKTD